MEILPFLIWEEKLSSAPKRLKRMVLRLYDFDLQLAYTKGRQLHAAD